MTHPYKGKFIILLQVLQKILSLNVTMVGRNSDSLRARWARHQIPVVREGAWLSAPVQTGPRTHPASCTMGTGSFPGVKSGRGVTLTPHLLLVPWSWKGRAIPLLPLWAVRPVQSLSACTRVHFTFTCNSRDRVANKRWMKRKRWSPGGMILTSGNRNT